MPDWLVIIGQALLVACLSFVAIALVASHLRYQFLTAKACAVAEPGPSALAAFELQVAQRIGSAGREGNAFVVARLAPADWPALVAQHGREAMAAAMRQLKERLANSIRASDLVMQLEENILGVILMADRRGGEAALSRIRSALGEEPITLQNGATIRIEWLAGTAHYPEDGDRAAALCEASARALGAARAGEAPAPAQIASVETEAASGAHTGEEESAEGLLDPLTGVLSRDRMGSALNKFVALRRRDNQAVSLVVADIDGLRRYNELYGRPVGDSLLRQFAAFLQRNTREHDVIARYLEDQFVIALDCAPEVANRVAQRLLAALRRESFEGGSLRLTATFGVAGWPGHGGTARELFEAAQLALLAGKSRGRNQVAVFEPDMRKLSLAPGPADAF